MKLQRHSIILACFLVYPTVGAYPVIRLSMQSLPDPMYVLGKIRQPGKIGPYQWQGIIQHAPYQGIMSSYSGFLGTSDYNGQTLFPLKQQDLLFYIMVTEGLFPITMFANTIHHWELIPTVPATMFKCEIKKEKENLSFWHIEQIPLPEDNIIPLQTIVIIANPDYIIMPTGITAASNNPNILFPPIYVKKGINVIKDALFLLNVRHLFANVSLQYSKQPKQYELEINQ